MEKIEIVSKGVVVKVTVEQLDEVRGREISWPAYSQHRLGHDHREAVRRATRNLRSDLTIMFQEIPPGFAPVYHRDFAAVGSVEKEGAPVTATLRKGTVLGGHVEYSEDFDSDVAEKLFELTRDYTAIRKLVRGVSELGVRKAVEKALEVMAAECQADEAAERPRG